MYFNMIMLRNVPQRKTLVTVTSICDDVCHPNSNSSTITSGAKLLTKFKSVLEWFYSCWNTRLEIVYMI